MAEVAVVPGNPNVIEPVIREQAPSPPQNQAPAGSGPANPVNTWTPTDEYFKTKGFKSEADISNSYRELERHRSQVVTEYQKAITFLQQLEPHQAEIEALLAGKAKEGKTDEAGQLEALLKSGLDPVEERIQTLSARQAESVRDGSIDTFYARHPDAVHMAEEIAKLIGSDPQTNAPRPIQVRDFYDRNSYLEALELAYQAIKGRTSTKANAGRQASLVAGGGGGKETPGGNREFFEMDRKTLEAKIMAGEV